MWTDGTNYFSDLPLFAGSNITLTPAVNGMTIAASGATAGAGISISGTAVSQNVSDRTLFQQYDEFDANVNNGAGTFGRLNWGCGAAGTGATISMIAGPSLTGAADFSEPATSGHDNECSSSTAGATFVAIHGNMSTYTFDQMYTFQSSIYGNSTTGFRFYFGLAGTRVAGAPSDGFVVRYDPSLGAPDTTFHVACYKASTTPVTDVSTALGAPTVSQNYSVEIFSTVAGTIGMTVFDNTGAQLYTNSSVCTGSNVTTSALGPVFSVTQLGSSAQTFDIDRYSFKRTSMAR